MTSIRSYKLKITSDHPKFLEIGQTYLNSINWLSLIVFQREQDFPTANHLQREFYSTIREKFQLPSQLTCSLFKHVVSTYKSMKTQGEWSLATYKRLTLPVCWRKDFNVSSKGLTIWKEKVTYESQELPSGKWSDSKLKLIKGTWYLCLSIKIELPPLKTEGTTVGVDRGQKNILVAKPVNSNKTLFTKGTQLDHRRRCIRQTRDKVASVGTRSSYRLLKRLSGREKAVTHDIMHIASKRLVNFAQKSNAKTISFEDLKGIKKKAVKSNKKLHHKQRARNNRWPYYMLEFFTTYKARNVGITVEHVEAAHTSQCCPRCSHTSKSNRNGLGFRCVVCQFRDHADRVGATNVGTRSLFQGHAPEGRGVCQSPYSSHEESFGFSELQTATL